MTWLSPLLAGVAAAIAVPTLLILYFLKLRRQDVEVSTTLLWKKAIEDLQANAPFQKLRRNLLLFLQLLILAAALLAIGQPQIKGNINAGRKFVILIDRSASMQSIDEVDGKQKRTRLDAAKAQARALVDSMREPTKLKISADESSDEAMLIAFDSTADVRQQFTSDKSALRAAIDAIEPTDGPGLLTEAVQLAKAHAPKRIIEGKTVDGLSDEASAVTLHLWTDGRLSDADRAGVSPQDEVVLHQVGSAESPNLAIVTLRSERSFEDAGKLTIFVGIESTDRSPRIVDAELTINGKPAAIKSVQIPAATVSRTGEEKQEGALGSTDARPVANVVKTGSTGVVFQLDRYEGGLATVKLRASGTDSPPADDVLAVDDQASLVLAPAKKLRIAMVSSGNLFLRTALEGLPTAKFDSYATADFESRLRARTLPEYDCIVLDGYTPPKELCTGSAGLPPGRWLLLGTAPQSTSGMTVGLPQGAAKFIEWKKEHPALRQVNLDEPTIGDLPLVTIVPGSSAMAIANTDKGPGIILVASIDTRAIVVPFDVAKSDWPFNLSWVIFLASSTRAIGDDAAGAGTNMQALQPNSILSDRIPQGASNARIRIPGGDITPLTPSPDGTIVFGPLRHQGVYEVSWSGQAGPLDRQEGATVKRLYAANLLDDYESNIAAANVLNLRDRDVSARSNGEIAADRKLWPWLLLAALAIILFEWFIYNRKVYV
jgi:hypothetical protein